MSDKLEQNKIQDVLARTMEQVSQETYLAEESFGNSDLRVNSGNFAKASDNTAWFIREHSAAWLIREPSAAQIKGE